MVSSDVVNDNVAMAQKVFADELRQLSPGGRALALQVFEKFTPNYFWTAPASSTGKYHPAISSGRGGVVRHTKYAFWWVQNLGRAFSIDPGSMEMDACLTSILLHDLRKFGATADPVTGRSRCGNTTSTHGVELGQLIQDAFASNDRDVFKEIVIAGIVGHMGKWTSPEAASCWNVIVSSPKVRQCVILIHIADMAAAQKADECLDLLDVLKD
jgi:hypothetical protein